MPVEKDGYKLVPVEPIEEQLQAGLAASNLYLRDTIRAIYVATVSAYQAAGPVPERSPADFAIEFGGYLANAAEEFMGFLNETGAAVNARYQSSLTDQWRSLESAIYEFRKRAERAAVPAAPALAGQVGEE